MEQRFGFHIQQNGKKTNSTPFNIKLSLDAFTHKSTSSVCAHLLAKTPILTDYFQFLCDKSNIVVSLIDKMAIKVEVETLKRNESSSTTSM